ncbi:alpha-N-acetylgalactosaminide alpha-2,6-sialyltransferase 1 isoform X2 [Dasypus novemcinctus]|uniref:alpha-N-acetylgalactosaminide alpha-2,6-sialyltransferase 1 isoform X2 n=1 Tax=Dasypus novemcinctus TaxID=9361 RepID=UPI0039C98ECA
MRSCLRRLCHLGRTAQWPLLLAVLILVLFSFLPSFIKEPSTRPARLGKPLESTDMTQPHDRYQDIVKFKERSPGSLQKANFQTLGRRITAHVESLRGNSTPDMWFKTTTLTAREHRTAKTKWSSTVEAPAEGQGQVTTTAKTMLPESREKEKIRVEMLSPTSQGKGVTTVRTEALSLKTSQGRGTQNKKLTTKRTELTRHQDNRETSAKPLTPKSQDKMVATTGTVSLGRRKEETTPAAVQEKRTSIETKTKAKAKVKVEAQTPKQKAQATPPSTPFQRPTTPGVQKLKAINFKSEPRWDFEENYSLEVGGLQTTCPNSVKVKASKSQWLQNRFLPNLTLFLDSKHFNQMVEKVVTQFPPVPQQQLLLASLPAGSPKCVSCAVVGNGGILNNSRMGQEIDSHDYVFRLSGAVIKGYEQDVGTRTSFYGFTAFSLTQSLLILGHRGFQHVPLGKDIRYLHFLEGARDFDWLEALLLNQTMKRKSLFWFRQRPQEAFREALQMDRYLLLHPDLLRYLKNRFLRSKNLDTTHWRLYRPTTGALLLLTALQLCDQVSAYGFITEGHERFSDHYYDKTWKPVVFYINHDFKLERALWKQLHQEGMIRLYQRPVNPKAKT